MQPRKHKLLSAAERAVVEHRRRISLTLSGVLLGAVLVLGGCSAMQAQNPPGALRPVNAVA